MSKYISKTPTQNPRNIVTVSTATTLDKDNSKVNVTGTTTITLPSIATLHGLGVGHKTYTIVNTGTAVVTVGANSADSIGPSAASTWTLNDTSDIIVIKSNRQTLNWDITNWEPLINDSQHIVDDIVTTAKIADDAVTGAKLSIGAHYGIKVVETNGTTAVNVFSASGAPAALTITGVMAVAKDTVANTEVVLTNGTLAVATFDKLNTVGWVIAEEADMTNETVTSGDTLTVVTDTTGNAQVWITFESA
jgi:hypothetical protein